VVTYEVEHVESRKRYRVVRPGGHGLPDPRAGDELTLAVGHDQVSELRDDD
jgi:hypothetical protein